MTRIPGGVSSQSVWACEIEGQDAFYLLSENGRIEAVEGTDREHFIGCSVSDALQWVHKLGGKTLCVDTQLL